MPAPVPRGRVLLRVLVATAAFLGLVAFAAVLARLTLTPSPASESIAGANLRPGHSLRQYAEDYTFLAACKQLGGNLLLGAPFGLLLPLLVPRRLRMLRMVLLTAAVMSLVELVQAPSSRAAPSTWTTSSSTRAARSSRICCSADGSPAATITRWPAARHPPPPMTGRAPRRDPTPYRWPPRPCRPHLTRHPFGTGHR